MTSKIETIDNLINKKILKIILSFNNFLYKIYNIKR